MKLTVVTPLAIVVEAADVAHVKAEDRTGAFGILPGHADFLTALAVSVASWRDAHGGEHHVAVRGGVLQVHGGDSVSIATREAVPGDDLERLQRDVVDRFNRQVAEERSARTDARRLYLAAIRQISRYLRTTGPGLPADTSAPGDPGWRRE